jgi:hypothetical protein
MQPLQVLQQLSLSSLECIYLSQIDTTGYLQYCNHVRLHVETPCLHNACMSTARVTLARGLYEQLEIHLCTEKYIP